MSYSWKKMYPQELHTLISVTVCARQITPVRALSVLPKKQQPSVLLEACGISSLQYLFSDHQRNFRKLENILMVWHHHHHCERVREKRESSRSPTPLSTCSACVLWVLWPIPTQLLAGLEALIRCSSASSSRPRLKKVSSCSCVDCVVVSFDSLRPFPPVRF